MDKKCKKKQTKQANWCLLIFCRCFALLLTGMTVAVYCFALVTPRWKIIIPKSGSLYIDGIDNLMRNDILNYYSYIRGNGNNTYGLFHRCADYFSYNVLDYWKNSACTKNYVPKFNSDRYNECHVAEYYQYCATSNEDDFPLKTISIHPSLFKSMNSTKASLTNCPCGYPVYVLVCRWMGIVAATLLSIACLLFICYWFVERLYCGHLIKLCAIMLLFLSTSLFVLHMCIFVTHFEYEWMQYLVSIEQHYRSTQIYKLSSDAKLAIDKFRLSVKSRTGLSAILAWVVAGLSFIDGILLLITFRKKCCSSDGTTNQNSSSHNKESKNRFASIDSLPLLEKGSAV